MTTNEREIAIREGNKIYAETSYFTPRPQLDFVNARYVFCEGFDRGYIAATAEANKRIAELEREVAELKWKYERLDIEYDQMQDERIAQISELQASNNNLREALEEVKKWFDSNIELEQSNEYGDLEPANSYSYECYQFVCFINQSISATPSESLSKHDDKVIEKCAKVCEGGNFLTESSPEYMFAKSAAKAIRSLKEVK